MKRYQVTLEAQERQELEGMIGRGKANARKLLHARILLQTDAGPAGPPQRDEAVAAGLNTSLRTVERVRQRFVEEGLELALMPRPSRRVYRRKLDGQQEAHLIALACSAPPEGRRCWTLRLLARQMVQLQQVEELSHETVRQTLKKTRLSRT